METLHRFRELVALTEECGELYVATHVAPMKIWTIPAATTRRVSTCPAYQ
jgi:hypothetical protein